MLAQVESGAGAFTAVRGRWRALAEGQRVNRHTQLEAWARGVAAARSPGDVWVAVDDAEGPLAVLHTVVEDRRLAGVTVRILRNGVADGMLADRCLGSTVHELRRAVLHGLRKVGRPVDLLSFCRLRRDAAFYRLAGGVADGTSDGSSGMREETRFGGYSVIRTDRSADEWFGSASRNLKGGLRKARNRAGRQGEVATVEARAPEAVAAAFDDYVDLEAAGWKGAAGGLRNRPVEHELLRVGLMEASANGQARVRSLWVGETLAASQLALVAGSTLVLLKVAYNEELAPLAPGNLLMEDLVRRCCDDEDVREIDLVTRQDWHARWHPTVHPTFTARSFNSRRPAGLLGRALPAG